MDNSIYVLDTPIGCVEIISDSVSINAIEFKDIMPSKPSQLKSLPQILQVCVQQLQEYFDGKRKFFDFAISQTGTEFQQKVWSKLLDVEFGKQWSYLELSKKLGDAKAIRAVGTTNGKNKIAIVVPCHRIVGSDGSLTGYAGGLWRKKWLLEHEAKLANGLQSLF